MMFSPRDRIPDRGFVARQRAKGTPDSATARMGGWCLTDVQAVDCAPELAAVARIVPVPQHRCLVAMEIPEVSEILRHIAEQYDVTPSDILGHSHTRECVEPRHEAFAVVWELGRYSLSELSEIFNKTPNGFNFGLQRHYERLRLRGPARDW